MKYDNKALNLSIVDGVDELLTDGPYNYCYRPAKYHPLSLVSRYLTIVYGYWSSITFMIINSKSLANNYFSLCSVSNVFHICPTNLSFYYSEVIELMHWVDIIGF